MSRLAVQLSKKIQKAGGNISFWRFTQAAEIKHETPPSIYTNLEGTVLHKRAGHILRLEEANHLLDSEGLKVGALSHCSGRLAAIVGQNAAAGAGQAPQIGKSLSARRRQTKLIDIGMEPAADEAKPLAQVISEEIRIHAELVKAAGLVPQ